MQTKGRPGLTLTALIVLIVVFVYVFSSDGVVQSALRNLQGGPVYRGNPTGIALECVVRWDASTIDGFLEICEKQQVHMTFFVTNDWAKDNPHLLSQIKNAKHEIGVLGKSTDTQSLEKELEAATAIYIPQTISAELFMPFDDKYANKLRKQAAKQGFATVLSSIDIQSRTTRTDELVKRVADNSFAGAIIRFEPTKTMLEAFEPILAKLKETGLQIVTVRELIDHKRV